MGSCHIGAPVICYVNDKVGAASCDLYFYVDDAALLVHGKDAQDIETRLKNE